jgi:hypothetical protein
VDPLHQWLNASLHDVEGRTLCYQSLNLEICYLLEELGYMCTHYSIMGSSIQQSSCFGVYMLGFDKACKWLLM